MASLRGVTLALASLLLAGQLAVGQVWAWNSVKNVAAGETVRVRDDAGKEFKGIVTVVSDAAISIRESRGGEVSVERSKVRRVELRSGSRRVRNVLIGAGVGLAVGATVDLTLGERLRNEGSGASRPLVWVAPAAGLGALGGAFPAYITIYRVK